MELNLRASICSFSLSFLLFVSCGYPDEILPASDSREGYQDTGGNALDGELVSVRIKFLGLDNITNASQKAQAMIGNYLNNNELSAYTQVLDEELGAAEVKRIQDFTENQNFYLSSSSKNPELLANNTELPKETVYKILAYKKNGNTYVFDKQQNFVLGAKNPQIKLNSNQNYTLLIVSMGTAAIPSVVSENDFESVRFLVNQSDTNTEILYQRINDFIPNGNVDDNNEVRIRLKSKTTGIRIILDTSDAMGGGGIGSGRYIERVMDAKISYKRPKQVEFRLHDAAQMSSTENESVDVRIDSFGATNTMIVASDFVNNIMTGKNTAPIFSVVFKRTDSPKDKNISIALKGIKQETKQTFRIELRGCGAYLGPNKTNWKTFMCHNLGADYSRDPFVPSDKIHGDKYQWGMKLPIVKQADDTHDSPRKSGWNRTNAYNTWNNGLDDPCPDGWRVPTSGEWESVLNNNHGTKLGNWNANSLKVSDAGVGIGASLMLPAAGKRFEYGNTANSEYIDYRHATMATVWTSTDNGDRGFSAVIFKSKSGREQYEVSRDYKKLDALPVRCIKKD